MYTKRVLVNVSFPIVNFFFFRTKLLRYRNLNLHNEVLELNLDKKRTNLLKRQQTELSTRNLDGDR